MGGATRLSRLSQMICAIGLQLFAQFLLRLCESCSHFAHVRIEQLQVSEKFFAVSGNTAYHFVQSAHVG